MHAPGRCPLPDHDPAGPAPGLAGREPLGRYALALAGTTQDALYAVDAAGAILAWSWGAQNLYGFAAGDVLGRDALELLASGPEQAEFRAALGECISTGSAVLDGVRRRSDGVEVHVQSLMRWAPPDGGLPGFAAVSDRDVTEARRLERELSQQVWSLTGVQEFLKSVLDASTDYSIVALDLDRRVVAWNAGARLDFGYEAEVVRERPLASLVAGPSAADQEGLQRAFESCLADGSSETELTLARQDRSAFPARVTLTVRKDAFGAPAGFVLIAKDVTEERRAEGERRLALERLLEIRRLGEVDKLKTALLNTTSHELATPMTPIRLHLRVLRSAPRDQLSEPLRRAIDSLERNVTRLAQVIQGMVAAVQVQGGLKLDACRFDLADATQRLVSSLQDEAAKAQVALACVAPEPVPAHGDPDRLRQLTHHFLSNALRFTPPGGRVTVEVSSPGGRPRIRVQDTGPGLLPEQMARLFQPFSQVHDTSQQTRGGIGVGLYVCKAIAEAHGGQVRVESAGPGHGSAFIAELPAAREPPAERS